MVLYHGIEIEVICNDQSLPIYHDPDGADTETPWFRQNYVEAITGATFEVKFKLTEELDLTGCDGVRARIEFDGNKIARYVDLMRNGDSKKFTGFRMYDHRAQHWRKDRFSFSNLVIDETTSTSLSPQDIKNLGSIQLKFTRFHLLSVTAPIQASERTFKEITEVSEKVLKGKAITNYVSMAQGDLIERPCHKKNIITPVSGSLGMPMICDILYRSKQALQSLGCIRRTPSPEAVSAHGTRSTEIEVVPKTEASNVQVLKRENVALRLRLALLEQQIGSKSEASHEVVKQEGIKRERIDGQADSARKRPRTSGCIEVLDLTED